jgi:hypothetical protein
LGIEIEAAQNKREKKRQKILQEEKSGMKNNNAALQRISHEQEKGQGQNQIKITQKNLHTLKSRKYEIQKRYVN